MCGSVEIPGSKVAVLATCFWVGSRQLWPPFITLQSSGGVTANRRYLKSAEADNFLRIPPQLVIAPIPESIDSTANSTRWVK